MKTMPALLLMLSATLQAGEVTIVDVRVECPATCTFSVTLEHGDQGWNHYADRWDVLTLDGRLLGSRVLHHPHENEQPFTRSLSGVAIPAEIERVKVRARDSKHGYGEQEFIVDLPGRG
jgi:hypothetical protein